MRKIIENLFMVLSGILDNEENFYTAMAILETIALVAVAVVFYSTHHPLKGTFLLLGAVVETICIVKFVNSNKITK